MNGRPAASGALAVLAVLGASHPLPVLALTEAEARRQLVPLIRAYTDCFATHIRINTKPMAQARSGDWDGAITAVADYCVSRGVALVNRHDQLYGRGTGLEFVKGPYLADLPRALRLRLQPDLGPSGGESRAAGSSSDDQDSRIAAALEARKKLVTDAVAQHEECLISALADLAAYSTESAPVVVDVALDRCGKFVERRIGIGVAAFDMTREEASRIVQGKVAELRTRMITIVVSARAEAAKKQAEPGERPTTGGGFPRAQPL